MYLRCSALIQKQVSKNILFFAVDITFLMLVFQIFTFISLQKIKTLSLQIFTKNYAMRAVLDNKTYLFCSAL
jgi:hypothetical protein